MESAKLLCSRWNFLALNSLSSLGFQILFCLYSCNLCHHYCLITIVLPPIEVVLLKMLIPNPPYALPLLVSVFCSDQICVESVLNWQGLGAVHARTSGKDPPWAMYWIKLSTAFACSLLLNGNNEERFTSLEKIPYWVRTAGVQMYYCTSEMFVISKLAEVRISGNWHLWSYASFYKLVLEQWQAWTIMVQLTYIAV